MSGPVTLIWDGLAAHRAPAVKEVLDKCKRLQVRRLPSYAPELNPVELMSANGKGVKLRGIVPEDIDDLHIETSMAMTDIARDRHLLRSFFVATPLHLSGITK